MSATFDELRDLYQDIILDRGRNPRHMRALHPCRAHAHGDNPLCGDTVDVRLNFAADGSVAEAAFEARGCAISMASADLMVEAIQGRTPANIRALATSFEELVSTGSTAGTDPALGQLRALSGVSDYRSRIKCALLPWRALLAALGGGSETQNG